LSPTGLPWYGFTPQPRRSSCQSRFPEGTLGSSLARRGASGVGRIPRRPRWSGSGAEKGRDMNPFDDYEISGCRYDAHHDVYRVNDDDEPGPLFWTLYGLREGLAEAISDHLTRESAEALYFSITGKKFPTSRSFGSLASAGNREHRKIVIE